MFATIAMTLFLILFMLLFIMFIIYFDYMLTIARIIIMFMHMFAKRSLLYTWGVSGRHCVSVVLIRCLSVDTPYILGHVVDRGCDTPVESFCRIPIPGYPNQRINERHVVSSDG